MTELAEKERKTIERLKAFEPSEGFYFADSGGKDSTVVNALLDMAGVKFDAHYRLTSVDPPELIRFIKKEHSNTQIDIPRYDDGTRKTMWNLIPRKLMPPTRIVRYCCSELKEEGGDGRMVVTGVRWAESNSRAKNQGLITIMDKSAGRLLSDDPNFTLTVKGGVVLTNDNDDSRRMVEQCYRRHKTTVNPIIDWSDAEVWEFIKAHGIRYCELYNEGWKRLGCIGCPMAGKQGRIKQFVRWPEYKNAYLTAFRKMLAERERRGKTGEWETAMDVFHWWVGDGVLPGQIDLFEILEDNT